MIVGMIPPPFVGVVFYSLFKPATYGLCEDRSVIREACNRFLKGWKRMSGMSLLTVPFDLSCECGGVLLFLPFVLKVWNRDMWYIRRNIIGLIWENYGEILLIYLQLMINRYWVSRE